MPSSHLILCCPLLLLPPIPPHIRVFSNESTLRMRWPKYWSFSFSVIPSKEIPGLISFRMDWLDLLAVQGTLKSLLHTTVQAAASRLTKRGQEELPHVRGQGQRPRVPGCDGAGTAERSYPASKVRGGGREETPRVRGQGR